MFSGIPIICKHFSILTLIIFVVNFVFINLFYINNLLFNVNNAKTINTTFSRTIMTEDLLNYGQKVYISDSVKTEHTKSLDYSHLSYLVLTWITFCVSIFYRKSSSQFHKIIHFDFSNFSLFLQSSKRFNCF